jgi:hypothetical protein
MDLPKRLNSQAKTIPKMNPSKAAYKVDTITPPKPHLPKW